MAAATLPIMTTAVEPEGPRTVVMQATSGWVFPPLRENWQRRELLYFFARRDIKLKYAQTKLGWLWTFVQPVVMMLVFTLAFRKLGRVATESIPYPVFTFAGLTLWLFISRSIANGAESLIANSQVLTRTACPRLLMPLSSILSGLFDLAITFLILVGFAALYGIYPTWRFALAPLTILLAMTLVLGLSLILSAVNVRHRDVRNLLPLALQLLLFLSPIAYPLNTLGPKWTTVFAFNPLVGVIEAFRWSVVGTPPPTSLELGVSITAAVAFLTGGLAYFSRAERVFADVA